jgi:AbrB family looped-hinge helix DNA binding protein
MLSDSKKQIKMKVFPKGQVVIPIDFRRKYQIEIGDHIDVISTEEGILLRPALKKAGSRSLTDQLFGIFGNQTKEKPMIRKNDFLKAIEKEFIKEWLK